MDPADILDYIDVESTANSFTLFEEMRENRELCDIEIKVGDETFCAHRLVLAAGAPYFRAMFRSGMLESRAQQVTLEGVDSAALRSLINFFYTGTLRVTVENVYALLSASEYLQLSTITELCFEFISARINHDNAFDIRAYAINANHVATLIKTERFIRENFYQVAMSKGFLDMSYLTLKQLISRDDLFVMSEEAVLEVVLKWVKASKNDRRSFLPELLKDVRMTLLTPEYLAETVSTEELIRESVFCRTIVGKAQSKFTRSSSTVSGENERYCAEKHHLKCARIAGCAMYAVIRSSHMQNKKYTYSVQYYDSINSTWSTLCDFKNKVFFSHSVCSEEKLYLIDSEIILSLQFDSLKSTTLKGPYKIPSYAGITFHRQQIYVFGDPNFVGRISLQSGVCCDVGKTVQIRCSPGTISLGNDIYVTGGFCVTSRGFSSLKSVERYSPESRVSTEVCPMLRSRRYHGCSALNDKIFVCGGLSTDEITTTETIATISAEVYDPLANQWSFISPMKKWKSRAFLVPFKKKLYAIGDEVVSGNTFFIEVYDPMFDYEWNPGNALVCSFSSTLISVVSTTVASPFQ